MLHTNLLVSYISPYFLCQCIWLLYQSACFLLEIHRLFYPNLYVHACILYPNLYVHVCFYVLSLMFPILFCLYFYDNNCLFTKCKVKQPLTFLVSCPQIPAMHPCSPLGLEGKWTYFNILLCFFFNFSWCRRSSGKR